MKPAPFDYLRAASLEDACALLATHGPDARLIAGGQSLVPMMAMRLLRPTWLIDVADVPELSGVTLGPDSVVIGACTRQHVLASHAGLAKALPLLGQALAWTGHDQTRNRGTIGGSLVHADPSAEQPLAAVLLDATLRLRSTGRGERIVSARQFFDGPMSTVIAPDECLVDITFPRWTGQRIGSAFDEVAIRHGDFALASACAQISLDAGGRCLRVALALGGVAGTPIDVSSFAAMLVGQRAEAAVIASVADAVAASLEPPGDLHASPEYRRSLAGTLCRRVLEGAISHAHEQALASQEAA
jgi:CO/xanthine dehydrogenase FAD-binding subunit